MLVALLLQAALPDPTAFDRAAWARFSRSPALSRTSEEVAVAPDGFDPATRRTEHELRLVVSRGPGTGDTLWTSTRTCPAARAVVDGLAALPPPRPILPDTDITLVTDGVGYAVTLPLGYDFTAPPITLRSNVGTPLARWVDEALERLAPCWSPVELRRR